MGRKEIWRTNLFPHAASPPRRLAASPPRRDAAKPPSRHRHAAPSQAKCCLEFELHRGDIAIHQWIEQEGHTFSHHYEADAHEPYWFTERAARDAGKWVSRTGVTAIIDGWPSESEFVATVMRGVPSAKACAAQCKSTMTCGVWTWHSPGAPRERGQQCWLMNTELGSRATAVTDAHQLSTGWIKRSRTGGA